MKADTFQSKRLPSALTHLRWLYFGFGHHICDLWPLVLKLQQQITDGLFLAGLLLRIRSSSSCNETQDKPLNGIWSPKWRQTDQFVSPVLQKPQAPLTCWNELSEIKPVCFSACCISWPRDGPSALSFSWLRNRSTGPLSVTVVKSPIGEVTSPAKSPASNAASFSFRRCFISLRYWSCRRQNVACVCSEKYREKVTNSVLYPFVWTNTWTERNTTQQHPSSGRPNSNLLFLPAVTAFSQDFFSSPSLTRQQPLTLTKRTSLVADSSTGLVITFSVDLSEVGLPFKDWICRAIWLFSASNSCFSFISFS